MICYPPHISDAEAHAVEDYWRLAEGSVSDFMYSLREIDSEYKAQEARRVIALARKSLFCPELTEFRCKSCGIPMPSKSREEYKKRIAKKSDSICNDCRVKEERIAMEKAVALLEDYKSNIFGDVITSDTIDSLTFCELFYLLIITSGNYTNKFLSDSPASLSLISIESADHKMVASLSRKGALTYIPPFPDHIKDANKLVYGEHNDLELYRGREKVMPYRSSGSLSPGVYLNIKADSIKMNEPEISSIISQIHERVTSSHSPHEDIAQVRDVIKAIQNVKLWLLVEHVGKKFNIPICHSSELASLLDYLSLNYPPDKIHYTFYYMAKETGARINSEKPPEFISKHFFTKEVGNYIHSIEKKDWTLKYDRRLPATIQASEFEAHFTRAYIANHFNLDSLSTKEVVRRWLKEMDLLEYVEDLPKGLNLLDRNPEW